MIFDLLNDIIINIVIKYMNVRREKRMDKKVAGILCYISFLFLIPLIVVKDEKRFARNAQWS